jgi:hypothetical protein
MEEERITRAAIESVFRRVGLVWEDWMQDWDILTVSEKDVPRLLRYYDELTDDVEKAVLMRLFISAYDDCLQIGRTSPETEQFLVDTLTRDWQLHSYAVKDWMAVDDEDDGFKVSPLMRKLWAEHVSNHKG